MIEYQDDFIGVQLNKLKQMRALENNPYDGKTLNLENYFKAPGDNRAIFQFLADAGFQPPKLQALQLLRHKERDYQANPSPELHRELVQAQLNYDILR